MLLKVLNSFFGIEIVNEALLGRTFGAAEILRSFGAAVGKGSIIHGPLIIHNADKDFSNLRIGKHVHIGRNVLLDLTSTITIDDESVVSMNCSLLTHQDVGNRPLHVVYPRKVIPLHIYGNAYLGIGVTLLPGADIGESAVVGAGAVVVDSIPSRQIAVGIPARIIKALPEIIG